MHFSRRAWRKFKRNVCVDVNNNYHSNIVLASVARKKHKIKERRKTTFIFGSRWIFIFRRWYYLIFTNIFRPYWCQVAVRYPIVCYTFFGLHRGFRLGVDGTMFSSVEEINKKHILFCKLYNIIIWKKQNKNNLFNSTRYLKHCVKCSYITLAYQLK